MNIYIETERLVMRELLLTDSAAIYRLDSDPAVHKYVGKKPISTIRQAEEMIGFIRKQYVENGIGRWALEEKSTGNFIGWGGFKYITTPINNKTQYFDLGYRLIRNYWGNGYATEAAKACVDYGFRTLLLTDIFGSAHILNTASINVLEKVGLNRMEIFHHEAEPHYWYHLSKAEWALKSIKS